MDRQFASCEEDIFQACKIFDPINWPAADIIEYGNTQIRDVLFPRFQYLLEHTTPPTDVHTVLQQWLELKMLIQNEDDRQGKHPLSIYQTVYHHNRQRDDMEFTAILHVIHVTVLYPRSTAVVERGFSIMKQVKSDWRCNLANGTLDDLMRIMHEACKDSDTYDPAEALNRWWLGGQRRRRDNIAQYGPGDDDSSSDSD